RSRWISEAASGMPRAERRSCEYDAYVPDLVASRTFLLDGEVAADVADAEAARMWAGKLAEACGWPQEVRLFGPVPG
ncbi:MAG: hypothetical protein Q7J48_07655, partial [Nocardioides sp.]|nr:hypothetical protein [Nocardioides sp.]